jgi:hypothetical protein
MQLNLSKDFPILVDTEAKSQTLKFWSSDTYELYNKNNKPDWEYEDREASKKNCRFCEFNQTEHCDAGIK